MTQSYIDKIAIIMLFLSLIGCADSPKPKGSSTSVVNFEVDNTAYSAIYGYVNDEPEIIVYPIVIKKISDEADLEISRDIRNDRFILVVAGRTIAELTPGEVYLYVANPDPGIRRLNAIIVPKFINRDNIVDSKEVLPVLRGALMVDQPD